VCEAVKIQSYFRSEMIKFRMEEDVVVFVFHWSDQDKSTITRRFVKCANEFEYTGVLVELSQFLVYTLMTAKTLYFNHLKFCDRLQDLIK
jgi:hypothetical protein